MKLLKIILAGMTLVSLLTGCSRDDEEAAEDKYQRQLSKFQRQNKSMSEELRAEAFRELVWQNASRAGMAELVMATSQDKTEPDKVRAEAFGNLKVFGKEHPEAFDLLMEVAADKMESNELRTRVMDELAMNYSSRPGIAEFFMRIARDKADFPETRSHAIFRLAYHGELPPGYFELLIQIVEGKTEPDRFRWVASSCLSRRYPETPEVIAWAENAVNDKTELKEVRSEAEGILRAR